jgi:CRP/FNR family transcriptional regulator, anaerobic regulatory protein
MNGSWIDRFPPLKKLPAELRECLQTESRIVALPEGTRIFGPGQSPSHFLLLLKGTIRVQQVSESGREIVLYRVSAGESCALTTACLMGHDQYHGEGIGETPIEAVAIPRDAFDDLIARSAIFRQFVFTAFNARITDLFRVIEEVAFARMDVRLAQKLLQLKNAKGEIEATHQQLAVELGTAREVVSRQVNEFQRRGWLKSGRGVIAIVQESALQELGRTA